MIFFQPKQGKVRLFLGLRPRDNPRKSLTFPRLGWKNIPHLFIIVVAEFVLSYVVSDILLLVVVVVVIVEFFSSVFPQSKSSRKGWLLLQQ